MNSALYFGRVRHRRFSPKAHAFVYGLFMVYLDLDELDHVFLGRWFWSARRAAVARFRREDHFGDASVSLAESVRILVNAETGHRPEGPVRLLTHLRYFGYIMNPISVYYCFDGAGKHVEHIVLEVTNTPWHERHCYVLSPCRDHGARLHAEFEKALHVSPFMDMHYTYRSRLNEPGEALLVHLENHNEQGRIFDATLSLRRRPITALNLSYALLAYPCMTAKVVAAIYFEALRLWLKGFRYVERPQSVEGAPHQEIPTS